MSFVRGACDVLEEVKCHRVLTGLRLPVLLPFGRWKPVSAVNLPISCLVIKDAVDMPQDPAAAAAPSKPPQLPPPSRPSARNLGVFCYCWVSFAMRGINVEKLQESMQISLGTPGGRNPELSTCQILLLLTD